MGDKTGQNTSFSRWGQPVQDVTTPVQNIDIILSGDNIVFNTKM